MPKIEIFKCHKKDEDYNEYKDYEATFYRGNMQIFTDGDGNVKIFIHEEY